MTRSLPCQDGSGGGKADIIDTRQREVSKGNVTTIRTCCHPNHDVWTKHLVFFQVKCKARFSNFCWFQKFSRSMHVEVNSSGTTSDLGQRICYKCSIYFCNLAINRSAEFIPRCTLFSHLGTYVWFSPLCLLPTWTLLILVLWGSLGPHWDLFQTTHLAYLLQMEQDLTIFDF